MHLCREIAGISEQHIPLRDEQLRQQTAFVQRGHQRKKERERNERVLRVLEHQSLRQQLATGEQLLNGVEQKKHHTGNYMDEETLKKRAKEYFSRFVDEKLNVVAIPYDESPVEIVSSEWIKQNMKTFKINQKQMVHDLGMRKSDVSIVVNGSR